MSGRNNNIFSMRTLLTLSLITVGIIVMILVCSVTFSVPCVNNFYNLLSEYPESTLIDSTARSTNYVGIGRLQLTYQTSDDLADVESWYWRTVNGAKSEAIRARAANEDVPPVWNHSYLITELDNSNLVEIRLRADCLG